jgi:hypothetical protein
VQALLLHELAHIRRQDYLLNLLQSCLETFLCLNPFAWILSGGIRRERELCCDDLVLEQVPQRISYASALAALESLRHSRQSQLVLSAHGGNQSLFHRIQRIMETKKNPSAPSRTVVAVLVLSGLVLTLAAFSPSWGQKRKAAGKVVHSDTVQKTRIIVIDNGVRTEYKDEKDVPAAVRQRLDDAMPDDQENHFRSESEHGLRHLSEAIANVASDSLHLVIAKALKDLKEHPIERDIANALAEVNKIDWNSIRAEVSEGLRAAQKELNDPAFQKKIRTELQVASVEAEKGRKEAEKALRELRVRKMISVTNSEDGDARRGFRHDEVQDMLDQMEADQLIDRDQGFDIWKKGDELLIDGQAQSGKTFRKYSRYLREREVRISGGRNRLSVSVED